MRFLNAIALTQEEPLHAALLWKERALDRWAAVMASVDPWISLPTKAASMTQVRLSQL